MNWVFPILLLSHCFIFAEFDNDAISFLKELYNQSSLGKPKCSKCLSPPENFNQDAEHLRVFMSFSVPIESWKDLSSQLEQMGGSFVLRGLPENSVKSFLKQIASLREAGVNAPILIDPEAFEKYAIKAVPTVVLINGEKYDKITGNILLKTVLKSFAEKGSVKEIAKNILIKSE